MSCSTITREALSRSKCRGLQLDKVQRVERLGILIYKWPVSNRAQRTLEKMEERLYEPEEIEDTNETRPSRHNRTGIHMNSQRMWQHA